jgi:hypothetical protein
MQSGTYRYLILPAACPPQALTLPPTGVLLAQVKKEIPIHKVPFLSISPKRESRPKSDSSCEKAKKS